MGHAAVLVRGPAPVSRDVRRDQREHSLRLEAERATSSTAWQEKHAVARRHDTAQRAHHEGDRRAVLAEKLDVRPSCEWVRQLLRGMRLSRKKPAKCLKELHSPEQQHANTHRLFTKLCWLMDTHAVGADRVVSIDETSCRLLPVRQTGWGRRGKKTGPAAGQHQGGHDIHDRLQHGPWPTQHAGADRARRQDRRRFARAALAGAHSPRHLRERLGHDHHDLAARGRPWLTCSILAGRDSRGSSSGTWPASTPARPH